MKKAITLALSIMLLVTMFVMTGCSKQTTVEFTVEGVDAYTAVPVDIGKDVRGAIQRQEDPNNMNAPAVYSMNVWADGDYAIQLLEQNGNTVPFTLKIHNGKVEAETPEGLTVNATIK